MAHPILKALEGSSEKWLSEVRLLTSIRSLLLILLFFLLSYSNALQVLYAFNSGDLDKFYALEKHWSEWDDLKRKKEFLVGKIRLLAIMEVPYYRRSLRSE